MVRIVKTRSRSGHMAHSHLEIELERQLRVFRGSQLQYHGQPGEQAAPLPTAC